MRVLLQTTLVVHVREVGTMCVCVCVSVFELNDIDFVRSSILQCTYVIGALQVHVLNKCLPPLG